MVKRNACFLHGALFFRPDPCSSLRACAWPCRPTTAIGCFPVLRATREPMSSRSTVDDARVHVAGRGSGSERTPSRCHPGIDSPARARRSRAGPRARSSGDAGRRRPGRGPSRAGPRSARRPARTRAWMSGGPRHGRLAPWLSPAWRAPALRQIPPARSRKKAVSFTGHFLTNPIDTLVPQGPPPLIHMFARKPSTRPVENAVIAATGAGHFFATPLDSLATQGAPIVIHKLVRISSTPGVDNAALDRPMTPCRYSAAHREAHATRHRTGTP